MWGIALPAAEDYFTFWETSLVISNMLTCFLPPNTACSAASAMIWVFTFLSCSPCFLMYCQSFLVSSVRGNGFEPTITASFSLGWTGFMNAALGFRLAAMVFSPVVLWMDQSVLLVGFRLPRLYRHLDPHVIPIPDGFQHLTVSFGFPQQIHLGDEAAFVALRNRRRPINATTV